MDNFILLAIPFFILAGNIMAQGSISKKLVAVMQLVDTDHVYPGNQPRPAETSISLTPRRY